MSFKYVAVDDGCMAGAKRIGNPVFSLESSDAADLFVFDLESLLSKMVAPTGTAASAGNLVHLYRYPGVLRLGQGNSTKRHEESQGQENQTHGKFLYGYVVF